MVLVLCALVIRDILRPDRDPVRMAGDDDPSGGVLENADDRVTVPSLPSLWRPGRVRRAGQPAPAGDALPSDTIDLVDDTPAAQR
jgi:hypothetical protein